MRWISSVYGGTGVMILGLNQGGGSKTAGSLTPCNTLNTKEKIPNSY